MLRNALISLMLILVFAACGTTVDSASTPRQTATEMAPIPTAIPVDVSDILENATQLRDERVYLVTLKFKRSDFLDPIKNMFENEMKAVHETMVVGQSTYDQWTIGQEISSDFDGAGFFFNGDMATYSVTVEDKERLSEYYWVADDGSLNSMNADAYQEAMRQLAARF